MHNDYYLRIELLIIIPWVNYLFIYVHNLLFIYFF